MFPAKLLKEEGYKRMSTIMLKVITTTIKRIDSDYLNLTIKRIDSNYLNLLSIFFMILRSISIIFFPFFIYLPINKFTVGN